MTGVAGGNAKFDHSFPPALAAAWQSRIVRFPLDARPQYAPEPYIEALVRADLIPLPAIASADAFTVNGEARESIESWRWRIGDLVDLIQVGNEPDGPETDEGASWRMSQDELNTWLGEARRHFPQDRYYLVGPGLVSGNPEWLRGVRLDLVDSISPHPYARLPQARRGGKAQHPRLAPPSQRFVPDNAALQRAGGKALGLATSPLLEAYRRWHPVLTITEYDSRTPGMLAFLTEFPGVEMALCFCLHQYDSWGLIDHPAQLADFLSATGGSAGPVPQPEPQPTPEPTPMPEPFPGYSIGPGFVAALRKHGYTPVSDERYFNDDMSVLLAEKSPGVRRLLMYSRRTNDVTIFDAARVA